MSEFYYKEFCPKCNTKNWFTGDHYDGDFSKEDQTPVHECFSCHHLYIYPDEVNSVEDICHITDCELWLDVNNNVEEFVARYHDSEIGKETIE